MVNKIYTPEALRLVEVWERHLEAEFELKDADAALETMTDNPELVHVPICAGAVGREPLRDFYANIFIPQMPDDLELVLISRTVGPERVVDEYLPTACRWIGSCQALRLLEEPSRCPTLRL